MVFADATSLGAQIASGATTSVAICQAYIDRIAAKNGLINAVATSRATSAILADAAAADLRAANGTRKSAIDGVPFTLKMIFETEGLRTTIGNSTVDYVPASGRNSDVAAILKEAGAILIGKSNAPGGPVFTEPALHGRCKNPYNLNRATGGSSGGAAAAVAAGLTAFDIGADSAGSARLPASYCGVYGLKPSTGVISSFGDVVSATRDRPRLYRDLSVPGPIARSIDDLALLLQLLNKPTAEVPNVRPLWPLNPRPLTKVTVVDAYNVWTCNPPIQAALNGLLSSLTSAGVTVLSPGYFPLNEAQFIQYYDGLWFSISGLLARCYPAINPHAADWVNNGMPSDTGAYLGLHSSSVAECNRLLSMYLNRLGDCDVMITPTHAVEAPAFGTAVPNNITYMCMSILFNMIGAPSVSIPLGIDANGVPFGVQVTGRPHDDYSVLDFAKQIDAHSIGYTPPVL